MPPLHGPTVGIGVTLLLHCDLVVAAARSTRLITPFVQLGLVPEAASTLLLPRLLGHQRAAQLLFLGEPLDAATAREWGLVNRVVDDAALLEEARDSRRRGRPPARRRRPRHQAPDARRRRAPRCPRSMEEELRVFTERLRSPEFAAAAQAFFGKSAARTGGGT